MKLPAKTGHGLVATIAVATVMSTVPTGVNSFAVRPRAISKPLLHKSPTDASESEGARAFRGNPLRLRPSIPATALAAAPVPGGFAAAAFLPTCLGLWRSGYAVTYAYGGAMLASGLVQLAPSLRLRAASAVVCPMHVHAAIYAFYGARLCAFLLRRQLKLPEDRRVLKPKDATLGERMKRLPLISGVSALYYCMAAAPMRIMRMAGDSPSPLTNWMNAIGFSGLLLAAVADWYKSRVKARDGLDALVTTGPFRYLRHPNYTGEIVGWTFLCVLAPILNLGESPRRTGPWMLASLAGWAGIALATLAWEATAGLEKKQREKYGGTPEYEAWIKTSWSGPMIGGKDPAPAESDTTEG